MRGTMMDFPLTLTSILDRAKQLYPKNEIVSRRPDKSLHRYTYADFHRRAKALASALHELGVRPGDRVGTLMWNHHVHLEAYFGIPCAGAVLHTLNLRLHPDDIAYIVNHAGDRFVIVDDVLLPLWDKVRPHVRVEKVIVVSWSGATIADGDLAYEELLALARHDYHFPKLDENAAMGMCYTSGTTGKPKGVVYSHRAIVLHSFAAIAVDGLALGGGDVVLPVVPQFHANAWGIPFAATMVGAKQVFPGPHLDADNLLDLFESEQVTMAAGVPTVWLAILQALDKHPGGRKLVKGMRMVVGGSAAPEAMIRAFDKHGLYVVHAWGMTETSPLGTISNVKATLADADDDVKYAARAKQGVPAPFVEIRAIGDEGPVAWDGITPGELQVRGPWVAASYFALEDTGDRWSDDGWFRTGDVVTIDPEGYVKITDRTKDLIKSGGEWISSVDLENALMGHPAVKEAAVVAVPHPKWTERPLACIVLRDGASASKADLSAFLETKVAKWWLPDDYVYLDEIPRTSTGKFLKAALRERFKDHVLPTV
ncbi:MAG: long-chain fatty acid--CoA ligase [Polyangiales bacterium]